MQGGAAGPSRRTAAPFEGFWRRVCGHSLDRSRCRSPSGSSTKLRETGAGAHQGAPPPQRQSGPHLREHPDPQGNVARIDAPGRRWTLISRDMAGQQGMPSGPAAGAAGEVRNIRDRCARPSCELAALHCAGPIQSRLRRTFSSGDIRGCFEAFALGRALVARFSNGFRAFCEGLDPVKPGRA